MTTALAAKKDIVNKHISPELKKAIYKATRSEKEFDFYSDAFGKMPQSEIQKILDHWYNNRIISITNRDVLKCLA